MKIFIALLVAVILTACTPKPFTPPPECVGVSSFILEHSQDPAALDKGLLLINMIALDKVKGYTVDDAEVVLDQIDDMLVAAETTYAELVLYVIAKAKIANHLAGSVVFILGPDLQGLSSPLPINKCDVALVRAHLAKQRMLLSLYADEE